MRAHAVILTIILSSLTAVAQEAQRFETSGYSLAIHPDGKVELFSRKGGGETLLCTLGRFEFPQANLTTAGPVTIETGPQLIPDERKVHVANVATSIDSGHPGWPTVRVRYEGAANVQSVWVLMPEAVRVSFEIDAADGVTLAEGPATLEFALAEGGEAADVIKPARWLHHPYGGDPYQLTAGMAQSYRVGGSTLVAASDHGFDSLVHDGKLNLHVRKVQRPWMTDQFQAYAALVVSDSPSAMPLGVAAAGGDRIMLDVSSPEPFYLWKTVGEPMTLDVCAVNLFDRPLRVDVEFVARDFDGTTVAQGRESRMLGPCEPWRFPLTVQCEQAGPVYLDVTARHNRATAYERICLGVMPEREFLDGKESRFGIAAYRGHVGAHTSFRSQKQLLELMARIGVRWLRMGEDRELAHQMGFHTWYHNSVYGPEAEEYFADRPSWMHEAANRETWLRGNLQVTLNQHDESFEFSNELNLHGGEEKGVLAEKYTKDWLIPLSRLRDEMAPGMPLGGCVVANGDLTYMGKVHAAGGWDCFERLVFHAAGCPRSPDFDDGQTFWSYVVTLQRIHEALRRYGAKELWMSEYYAPAAPNSSCSNNERVGAEDITLMCGLAVAADVRGLMYYCLDDFDRHEEIKTVAETGEPWEREFYFGLIRRDWTPKAILWAHQTAAWMLDGAKFVGDAKLDNEHLRGLVFEGRRGRFALLWSREEGYLRHEPAHVRTTHRPAWEEYWTIRTPVELSASGPVTITDCIGRQTNVSPDESGTVTIEVTGAPVYVSGASIEAHAGRYSRAFAGDGQQAKR